MRVVTIVSLGGCALFGLAALVVAKTMIPNPATAKIIAAPVAGVPVVVAKGPLKFGDKLDATKIEVLNIPSNAVPEGAFTTTAQVLAQDGGGPPVALTPIAAREPLLPAKLSGPGARASIAAEIRDGFRAYTIKVTDVTGVGGHALPGDRVDVVLMRDTSADSSKHAYVSEVVIQDVRVLGVDLNADLASNKPATPNTATLEVSVPDAQKLAVAGDLGKLSLALRRTGSTEVAQTSPMRGASFVGGGEARPIRASVRRRPSSGPAPMGSPLIMIVEGDGQSEHKSSHKDRAPKAPPAAPPAPTSLGPDNSKAAVSVASAGHIS
ncbi:MAG TPA: Flp pilus assembly protein CpaB [Phenylobacterium sp.]|jgi:pilus assembly protein CpaB|uniref:Flp pilus assembly protein CpaB n=1 Tax=Phenylobacterium sp. TaxID=1871053 RepID=UPI002C5D58EC|nr:Flp pilus assembly protein CpaB [Phenylobacterium sp.]HXA41176.1 Flp pilus assembly protein CpaB [Phenylobacterium sp.]